MLDKYNDIWDKIKEKLNIKFHSKPVYDKNTWKLKQENLTAWLKQNCLGNEVPIENMHCTCIAYITIDSVMRMEKKLSASLFRS